MHARVLVTLPHITPIQNIRASIRPLPNLCPPKPLVRRHQHVRLMPPHIAAPQSLQPLHIRPPPMQIQREQPVPIPLRPARPLINHHPHMRMATTQIICRPIPRITPLSLRVKMPVIRDRVHPLKHQRIHRRPERLLAVRSRNQMPQMPVHHIDEKALTLLVPIVPPRIRRPVHHHLRHPAPRMKPPNPPLHRHPLRLRRPRCTDLRRTTVPAPPIQPTIRPPAQTIRQIVVTALPHLKTV